MAVSETPPRWWQRVLPVTGLALVTLAVAALLVPDVRQQVLLSATHQPQEYVALSFARDAAGLPVTCAVQGREVRVRFVVSSQLREPDRVGYVVVVTARGAEHRQPGHVRLDPGQVARVTEQLPLASDRYAVDVRLTGLDQHIHARCPRRLS